MSADLSSEAVSNRFHPPSLVELEKLPDLGLDFHLSSGAEAVDTVHDWYLDDIGDLRNGILVNYNIRKVSATVSSAQYGSVAF